MIKKTNIGNAYAAYESGDYTLALEIFMYLAEQGNTIAQFYVAKCYNDGYGVAESDSEAVKWYTKAAENGYDEDGYAVYPSSAVSDKGDVVYELPKVQTAHESGSFLSDVNLSSSKISLADLEDDGTATANFLNALSVLRVALSEDVTSVTVTGSAPFAQNSSYKKPSFSSCDFRDCFAR
mgnify:CR=1 FL=1